MIKIILQNAAALLFSLFVAILLLAGIEWIGAEFLYPFPQDFGGTREEVMAHVANYPRFALFVGGLGWGITIFLTTWLTTRLSSGRHSAYGLGLGLLLFCGAIFNMALLPYPIWYWVLNLILLPAGIYAGINLGKDRSAGKN